MTAEDYALLVIPEQRLDFINHSTQLLLDELITELEFETRIKATEQWQI